MSTHLNTQQAAEWLGVKPTLLRDWRAQQKGPSYIEVSRKCIRYALEDLIEWRNQRRHVPSVRAGMEDLRGSI